MLEGSPRPLMGTVLVMLCVRRMGRKMNVGDMMTWWAAWESKDYEEVGAEFQTNLQTVSLK